MKNYYRIILGRKHKNFDEAKKGNFVGVGFLSDIDLSKELADFLEVIYQNCTKHYRASTP
jgi:hypothetical protein